MNNQEMNAYHCTINEVLTFLLSGLIDSIFI